MSDAVDHAERLIQVVSQLAATRELTEIMAIVRTAARALTQADGVTFVIREAEHCYYADEDSIAPLWRGRRFPLDECVSGLVMRTREPVVIPDIYDDPRVPIDVYRSTFVRSLAMVPVRASEPIGAIGAYWATTRTATPGELRTLAALANSAALALANVQLYDELHAALERERTARVRAESAARGKDDFLAIVSHELRQPLHASVAALHVISGRPAREKSDRALSVLHRQLSYMTALIDDLLDASRIVRNQVTVRFERLDLRSVVAASVESSQSRVDEQRQHLSVRLPTTPVWVRADEARLRQVVINLLTNASKFSPPRADIGVVLTSDAQTAELRVRDSGRGIAPDVLPHIFDLFTRGDSEPAGFGIGLAVVRRLVELHGGSIRADSGGRDQGTEFTIQLPLLAAHHDTLT